MSTQAKTRERERERERESKTAGLLGFFLGAFKGSLITAISVIATIGILFAIAISTHAGSLTPPGAPASTMSDLTTINSAITAISASPKGMSAEGPGAGTYTHAAAAQYCYGLSAAAAVARDGNTTTVRTDWRLPRADEAAIFEGTITSANYIWTSAVYSTNCSWVIMNLSNGNWTYTGCTSGNYVRCVR